MGISDVIEAEIATPLRVLIVEDSKVDADIILDELRNEHYDPIPSVIDTPEAMRTALAESWDVIICDYVMPRFDGLAALKMLQDTGKNIPFIIISGKIGEDVAVNAIKKGANDYVMKNNLSRLGIAVSREMQTVLDQQSSDAVERILRTELGVRSCQLEVIAQLNKMALSCNDQHELMTQALQSIRETLGVEYCRVLEYIIEPKPSFVLQAGLGFNLEIRGQMQALSSEPYAHYTLEHKEPIIVEDFRQEKRFEYNQYGLVSGACLIIYGKQEVFGILQVSSTAIRYFKENDIFFLQSIANTIGITLERIRGEIALKESEKRFRNLADIAPFMITISNQKGEITYYNSTWSDYTGLSINELFNHHWISTTHPDDFENIKKNYIQMLQKPVSFEVEFRIKHISGEYRWILLKGVPREEEDGGFIGYSSLYMDIHERKQVEEMVEKSNHLLKSTISKLELSNKDLEHFATIASHDLQAPLRKVKAFSDMLKEDAKAKLDSQEMDALNRMQNSIQTMQDLVNNLLRLSHISKAPVYETVDLSDIMQKVLSNLQESIKEKNAQIKIDDLLTMQGDKSQLQQLFQNLVENALKFQPADQVPVIRISSSRLHNHLCEILVQDNGIGFASEYSDRVFETFERVDAQAIYPGNGLGLSICKRIVERHQGTITVKSEPQLGSTFTIILPTISSPI